MAFFFLLPMKEQIHDIFWLQIIEPVKLHNTHSSLKKHYTVNVNIRSYRRHIDKGVSKTIPSAVRVLHYGERVCSRFAALSHVSH